MAQLKEYSTERTDIEKQVYTTGSKLRTAMEENHNFIQVWMKSHINSFT